MVRLFTTQDWPIPATPTSDPNAFIARPDTTGQIGLDVAAPEPGTLFLFGSGALLLALARKKNVTRTAALG